MFLNWYNKVPLVSRTWLASHNLSKHAIDNLVKSQQLESVKNGLYKREGSIVEWGDILYYLQRRESSDLTVGGISALELQNLSHYVNLSKARLIRLYGIDTLPLWINKINSEVSFEKHSTGDLLGQTPDIALTEKLNKYTKIFEWKNSAEGLRISSPERAILEVLNEVPGKISFEHAEELIQGLNTLSPRALQNLLELCGNIKVRRLFFWYAERQNHSWLDKINKDAIDFGSGNRVIVKGGKLNKKYKITVPKQYE